MKRGIKSSSLCVSTAVYGSLTCVSLEENVACRLPLLIKSPLINWIVRLLCHDWVWLDHKSASPRIGGRQRLPLCYLMAPWWSWWWDGFADKGILSATVLGCWTLSLSWNRASNHLSLTASVQYQVLSDIGWQTYVLPHRGPSGEERADLEVIWYFLQLQSVLWRLSLTPVCRTHLHYSSSLSPFLWSEATVLAHRTSKATGCNCIKWIW